MKTRNKTRFISMSLTLILIVFLTVPATVMAAESTVNLGTTASFAVLAGTTITNTGPTTIGGSVGGNIGVSPGSAITGFPPGTVTDGTIHSADATALQAQVDLAAAYNDAAGRAVTANLTGQDLGGLTLTAGVYKFSSSAQLTGTLILDAQGDPEAVFIFQISSTLTTASNSVVSLTNGARFCRVFWQVGSSATLGTNTQFVGHIFALTSIAAQTGVTVQGQLLARNGAVTLDNNTITNGVCEAAPTPTSTTAATTSTPTTAPTAVTTAVTTVVTTVVTATAMTTAAAATTTVVSGADIPKTGETNNSWLIGLLLLGLAGSLFILRWRRKVH
ncbi:MAG: ice-binding family protein [Clostridiaceae bacterium]|nr:ice-binding family protein [Clostridiaceae bacterium]